MTLYYKRHDNINLKCNNIDYDFESNKNNIL